MNIQWLPAIKGSSFDLIQRLLVNNPTFRLGHRLGAPEIKAHAWFDSINWKRLGMRQVTPPTIPNLSVPELLERERRESGEPVTEFEEIVNAEVDQRYANIPDPFRDF
jgi:hypothetical protein